jgi:hypothetical protein
MQGAWQKNEQTKGDVANKKYINCGGKQPYKSNKELFIGIICRIMMKLKNFYLG